MTIHNILIATIMVLNIMFTSFLYLDSSKNRSDIISAIEKHSVHPIHGKVDLVSMKCQPWDSCR